MRLQHVQRLSNGQLRRMEKSISLSPGKALPISRPRAELASQFYGFTHTKRLSARSSYGAETIGSAAGYHRSHLAAVVDIYRLEF